MYRPHRLYQLSDNPQFPLAMVPPGYRDEPYAYVLNVLQSGGTIPPLGIGGPYLISMDQDADFYLQSIAFISVPYVTLVEATFSIMLLLLGIQITDTFGHVLSDDFLGLGNFGFSPLTGAGSQANSSGFAPVFMDPIRMGAGGVLQFSIRNFSDTLDNSWRGPVEFRGFKRYKVCSPEQDMGRS